MDMTNQQQPFVKAYEYAKNESYNYVAWWEKRYELRKHKLENF